MATEKIGILTGGGDCAGLNPAIKWVVKTAMDKRLEPERGVQCEVLGIRNGWSGLMFEAGASLKTEDYITVQYALAEEIKMRFSHNGITVSFP